MEKLHWVTSLIRLISAQIDFLKPLSTIYQKNNLSSSELPDKENLGV
jgi:hypothetical protein